MNQDVKDFFDKTKYGVIDVTNDSKQVAQAIKETSNGKSGFELILTENGELVAGPSPMLEKVKGTKAVGFLIDGYAAL